MRHETTAEAAAIEPPPHASASERTVARAAEGLAGHGGGLRTALAFCGPAVIASIAYMDPGNFATNIQAGAKYGYSLLWVVLLANVIAMLFQGLAAKLGIVTGRNLAELCRERFPHGVVMAMWAVRVSIAPSGSRTPAASREPLMRGAVVVPCTRPSKIPAHAMSSPCSATRRRSSGLV